MKEVIDLTKIPYNHAWGWGNASKDHLAVFLPENVDIYPGEAILIFPNEDITEGWMCEGDKIINVKRPYSSGLIRSARKFRYGRFRFKVHFPDFRGAWPAIWLYNEDGPWPPEIDIVEQFRKDRFFTRFKTQSGIFAPYKDTKISIAKQNRRLKNYHKDTTDFVFEWTKDHMTVFVDGRRGLHITDSDVIIHHEMNLIINLAIGDWEPENGRFEPFEIILAEYEAL